MGYGRAWCGAAIDDVEHVINKEDDGITFPPNVPQCENCRKALAPMNRAILDMMLGKLSPVEAIQQHDAAVIRAAMPILLEDALSELK